MSLREHLRNVLPDILPPDPKDAIKGTELIELVKTKLEQKYSDATLRYHFSIMSCDPSAPIAKVEHGQGYYLRTNTLNSMKSARHMISPSQATFGDAFGYTTSNEALLRANKFRAVVGRCYENEGKFPFILEETFGEDAEYEDLWKYPDVVAVTWQIGQRAEGGVEFDRDQLQLQRSFGSQPFTLRSMKLKLEVRADTFREDLFQCLSNSRWAHFGELIIAEPIEDESVVDGLRSLGVEFGIGITSFGMTAEVLDELPEPGAIRHFAEREMEGLNKRIRFQRIAESRPRSELGWDQVRILRDSNREIEEMFQWLTYSLDNGQAQPFSNFRGSIKQVDSPISV